MLDCAIHAPPPPSGELNPDLPDAEVDEFANLGPPPPPPLWSLGDGLGLTAAGVHPWAAPTVGDVLKAPPKPLCPPTWDFDYDWQSCWPADVPHPPPPVGSQWEHACRCGPGMSWLATVHTCWTHGTRPGSSQLGSDAFTGYGPGPAHGTSYLGGVSFVDMPYRTYVFEASQSRVEDVMGDHPKSWDIEKIWRVGMYEESWTNVVECHMQGIAHCETIVVTSCMNKSSKPEKHRGYLQFYEYQNIHHFETAYQQHGAGNGELWSQRVLPQPWPHAVVGQSIRGYALTNDAGILQTQFEGQFLFPVGSEDSGMPSTAPAGSRSNIRIYDKDGHWYPEMETHIATEYACGALFSYKLPPTDTDKQELCLLVIDKGNLSLLHYPWHPAGLRFSAPRLLISAVEGYPEKEFDDTESLVNHGYQAINFFYGSDEVLYLIGTHDRWMDTYRISIAYNEDEEDESLRYSLAVEKIANVKYPVTSAAGGLFDEGVAIQSLSGENKMRVWCAPYDYRYGRCVVAV